MYLPASHLRCGDIVTGVWSDVRQRCDSEYLNVLAVDIDTSPDGVRLVTIHTGPQSWQRATYCADTTMRIAANERTAS